ncbi:acyl-CoA dehydrogenase family protein [Streptomyces hygroscopicus]|uniref:acyl-CoA dehydrogenase family protein n=1 Tax=Streptomyces hygroscopicus TaxID=1912 RepID=UPI0036BB99AD
MSGAVDFQLTDDQRALKAGMRELLERRFPRTRLRAAVDGEAERGAELDRELWRELGAAGLFALRVPESAGGVGLGLPEAVLAFEEAGRALLPGPLAATELTAHLSAAGRLAGGAPVAGRWVAEGSAAGALVADGDAAAGWLADGDAAAGWLAGGDAAAGWLADGGSAAGALVAGAVRGETVVTALDQGGALVEHLASADAVLALGATAAEVIPAGAVARSAEPIRSVDPATPLHRTAPYRTAAHGAAPHGAAPQRGAPQRGAPQRTVIAGAGASGEATTGAAATGPADRLRREAALLTAAQQLGSASRTVELAVEHAKRRTQFGRPIGAFQAVQHLCAGMLVRAESARSVVYAAAVTEEPGDIAAAKLLADEAAVRNARDCLQVHGGMGFTWEADVHLHLKRAWVRAGQWQCAAEAEEELAAGLLSTVGACL